MKKCEQTGEIYKLLTLVEYKRCEQLLKVSGLGHKLPEEEEKVVPSEKIAGSGAFTKKDKKCRTDGVYSIF